MYHTIHIQSIALQSQWTQGRVHDKPHSNTRFLALLLSVSPGLSSSSFWQLLQLLFFYSAWLYSSVQPNFNFINFKKCSLSKLLVQWLFRRETSQYNKGFLEDDRWWHHRNQLKLPRVSKWPVHGPLQSVQLLLPQQHCGSGTGRGIIALVDLAHCDFVWFSTPARSIQIWLLLELFNLLFRTL